MSPLATLFRHELRMLARDTRMILIGIVLPLVVFPVLILVLRSVDRSETERIETTVYTYAVTGSRTSWARDLVDRALALPDAADTPGTFEERRTDEPDTLLAAGELHLVIEGADAEADSASAATRPVIRLRFRAQSDFSRAARSALDERLRSLRDADRDSILRANGFPVATADVAEVVPMNAAPPEREGNALLGLVLTPFVLLLMLTGGSIAAVDTLSGEKERGTLESLLTTGLSRTEIVRAKLLAIACLGLVLVLVNAANLLVYLVIGVLDLPENLAFGLAPLDVGLVLLLLTPLAVLVAAALLLLSGRVDGYKEFQIAFFPLLLAFVALSVAGMLPGMELRSAIALVPVAGVGVAVREIVLGQHDWPFLALAWASSGGLAWLLVGLTERTLSTERLVGGASLDELEVRGGPALFPRRVLRWFAVLWAVFFTTSLWLGESLGLRGQIVLNLVVLFGGGSVLMLRGYRLDWRQALSLRMPPRAAWVAVLVGAPAGYLVGVGLAELVDVYLFPVPDSVLEAFGDVLLEPSLPLWQLLLFVAVMPAVFEEIAFRGVLQHGLAKRLRPLALCLAVGAIFGLFHVTLFRILPTAYLGVVLAATVVLTGSIYPAMLWHALNNAVALVPARLGWIDQDTEVPGWAYAAAVVGLALSLVILWRFRAGRHRTRSADRAARGDVPPG
ncbi:MAG: CPBP family glutamic-type intramembrane protease [Gemmatimonadota bacterium]